MHKHVVSPPLNMIFKCPTLGRIIIDLNYLISDNTLGSGGR